MTASPRRNTKRRRISSVFASLSCAVVVVSALGSAEAATGSFPGENGKIAFTRLTPTARQVYVMNANGSGQTNVSQDAAGFGEAAWSPDGSKIAFTSARNGNFEVYAMNPNGSGQTNLSKNAAVDSAGDWSPDGGKIAFTSGRNGNLEVYVMNANGSGQTNVSQNAASDSGPDWSPDGSKIAFTSRRNDNSDIYVMNANGSGQTNLSQNPAIEMGPAWQTRPSADLSVALAASPTTVMKARRVSYTITVRNAGLSNALGVTVTDRLPSATRFVSAVSSQGACRTPRRGAPGAVRCSLGFLPSMRSATVKILVKVTKAKIENTAVVASTTHDPDRLNNAATVATTFR